MEKQKNTSKGNVIMNSLKIIGLIILAVLPINLAITLIAYQEEINNISTLLPWILGLIWLIVAGLLMRWMWQYYLRTYSDERAPLESQDVALIFGLFIFFRVIALGETLLNEYLTGAEMMSNDAALAMDNPLNILPINFIIVQLAIGIVGPILEELVFRGLFNHLLFGEDSFWVPGILSSVIFSYIHEFDNLITFLMYFIMGFTFYYVYKRRNTIKDSIILHILNNALTVIMLLIGYVFLI